MILFLEFLSCRSVVDMGGQVMLNHFFLVFRPEGSFGCQSFA